MSTLTSPSASVPPSASQLGQPVRRAAIDLIKGFGIISVIALHTLPYHALTQTAAIFHIWQAVPVFMCVMGLNGVAALGRRGGHTLRDVYSRGYLAARFDRVVIPFVLAFLCTVVVAGVTHRSHYDPFMFIGELPIRGPGNYFIALVFQYALLIPLVYWALRRWRTRALLLCLAIDASFEIIAPHLSIFAAHPYLYSISALRFLFLVALGGAVAGVSPARLLRSWWLWLGASLSVVYITLVYVDVSAIPVAETAYRSEAFPAAFYPLLLVTVGLCALPSAARGVFTRGIAQIGRASYHIFLVQIIWFGAIASAAASWGALGPNLAGTMAVGLIFYRATARASLFGTRSVRAATSTESLAATLTSPREAP